MESTHYYIVLWRSREIIMITDCDMMYHGIIESYDTTESTLWHVTIDINSYPLSRGVINYLALCMSHVLQVIPPFCTTFHIIVCDLTLLFASGSVLALRGFAKLKKIKKSKENVDRPHPTHPPPIQTFFGTHHWHWQKTQIIITNNLYQCIHKRNTYGILLQNVSTGLELFGMIFKKKDGRTVLREMWGRQERRKTGRRRQETEEGGKDYQMRRRNSCVQHLTPDKGKQGRERDVPWVCLGRIVFRL